MFRKPKRKAKESIRRKEDDEEEESTTLGSISGRDVNDLDDENATTSELLSEARKKAKQGASSGTTRSLPTATTMTNRSKSDTSTSTPKVMQTFTAATNFKPTSKDLATSTNEMHVGSGTKSNENKAERGADGIFRDSTRNKFHAGPIKAAQNVRVTARFDYQPDVCKDYKETGFCGFGDSCIYLHDRGDFLTGWQIEQQWEEEQKKKKELQEKQIADFLDNKKDEKQTIVTDDGLPFACYLCRNPFTDPVVTNCSHYFCQDCIIDHVRNTSEMCPVCSKDTHSVFNEPTKLIAKKRRVLGITKAKEDNSWEQFAKAMSGSKNSDT